MKRIDEFAAGSATVTIERLGFSLFRVGEPPVRFRRNSSVDPQDIVRYAPYSSTKRIEAGIAVLCDKSLKNAVDGFLSEVQQILSSSSSSYSFNLFLSETGREYADSVKPSDIEKWIKGLPPYRSGVMICIAAISDAVGLEEIEKLKAVALLASIGGKKRLHILNGGKLGQLYSRRHDDAGAWRSFLLNNSVQLYAKAGGVPWVIGGKVEQRLAPDGSAIVGVAFRRWRDRDTYYGVADIRDIYGYGILFYVIPPFRLPERVRGLYLPEDSMSALLEGIRRNVKNYNVTRVYIYKSSPIHDEELKALDSSGLEYTMIHYGIGAFPRRGYVLRGNTVYTIIRGVALLDESRNKITLWATGDVSGRMVHKLGTPRPVELTIRTNTEDIKSDRIGFAKHICWQSLALCKLDWESTAWERKEPVVLKYARRAAGIGLHLGVDSSYISSLFANQLLDVRDLM